MVRFSVQPHDDAEVHGKYQDAVARFLLVTLDKLQMREKYYISIMLPTLSPILFRILSVILQVDVHCEADKRV